jgi:hypothetical protein
VVGVSGTSYVQDVTNHILPANVVERYLQFQRETVAAVLAEMPP